MANTIRVTDLGNYVELNGQSAQVTDLGSYLEIGGQSINLTDLGVYLELLEFTNSLEITSLGSYVELAGQVLEVTDLGAYVESVEPYYRFAVYFDSYRLCNVTSVKVNQSVKFAKTDVLIDLNGNKLPIIPDWSIDVTGFWCKELSVKLGSLTDQEGKSIAVIVTDRFLNTIMVTNLLTFVTSFVMESNIDNVLTYKLTFVGSGSLNSESF